jgi:SAM-dependent methyltransferase
LGCCDSGRKPNVDLISQIYDFSDTAGLPDSITGLSLGCGDPISLAVLQAGQTVLDLGSGGGIDCFLAAKRVGESGRVIGIDMTPEMVEQARANKARLGVDNVEFRLGEIEHLPVGDETVDVIISNCVINLSVDKDQVFRDAFRVLKPGGKLAISDMVTDKPLPQAVKDNLSAWAECVAGALDIKSYISVIEAAGFNNVELTPIRFDKISVEANTGQMGLDAKTECGVSINGSAEAGFITVMNSNDASPDPISKMVFSAKITAYKPI